MKIARRVVPAEIPTASMADVAFLLIIFFLVASFYSVTRGIQFSLPKHDEAALTAEPEAATLIEIASSGQLTVDGRPMPLQDLRGYLAPKLERNPTKSVILQTSLDAQYEAMTDVFDELRQVGVQNLVIPTSTELQLYGLQQLR
ncbi:MAG TPA: biopolymer transporter ExbD [Vicinamibacterales bacterium]|nr:biopolymer transporter ExbD [Vicinamibacterales bacterium]